MGEELGWGSDGRSMGEWEVLLGAALLLLLGINNTSTFTHTHAGPVINNIRPAMRTPRLGKGLPPARSTKSEARLVVCLLTRLRLRCV